MLSALQNWLFSPAGLTAHGFCLLWEPWLIWTHAIADAVTGLAYLTIPLALAYYVHRRQDMVFKPVLYLFAAFILLCGAGHGFDLLTLWVPVYRLEGLEKAATAIVSLATAAAVWYWMPMALAIPSAAQMQRSHDALRASEAQFREASLGRQRLRTVVEASPTALLLAGPGGEIKMANAKAEHLFGYDRATLQDQNLETLVPPEFRQRHVHLRADFLTNMSPRAMGEGRELFGLRQDGTRFPLEIGLNPIELDGQTMVLAAINDVTARHAAEQAMRQEQEALAQSNAELIRARLRAEQATRAKSRFLAGMSHELRTPLNGILGYAELLQVEGGLTEQQNARVQAMQEVGRHLLGMITKVLDLSVIESGQLKLLPAAADPRDVVTAAAGIIQPTAEAAGLALSCDVAADVSAAIIIDATRVRQVLLNLLANAVKFTRRGSVVLRVRMPARRDSPRVAGSIVRFEVADTGRGVAPERRAHLFQEFERLGADPDGAVEGAGLGLAISAHIAAAMGGRILHEDNPGGGSIFAIELPLRLAADAADAPRAPVPEKKSGAAASRHVLVVDDIAMNRDITGSFLRSAGHKVVCAEGGAAAVDAVAGNDFDIVLMDLRMPEIDGFEATRRIRALGGTRGRVPILALTAQAFSEQIEECWRAGMVGHLAKPFTQEALLRALAEAMQEIHDMPHHAATAEMRDLAALRVMDLETFETSAAFLSPQAVVNYLEAIVADIEEARRSAGADARTGRLPASGLDRVHTLAGKAGMFGFVRLTAIARLVERAGRAGGGIPPDMGAALGAALDVSLVEARMRLAAARKTVSAALPLAAVAATAGQ